MILLTNLDSLDDLAETEEPSQVDPYGRAASTQLDDTEDRALQAAVRRAVCHICPSWLRSDVDDLVQDTMIRLLRWQDGNGKPSSAIVRKTAHWVTVDRIRLIQRRRTENPGDLEGTLVDRSPDPERTCAGHQAGRAILECLASLPEARRRAVTLHLLGHTMGEIADLLGWSPKRAENLAYRGLSVLRDSLESRGVDPRAYRGMRASD